MHQSAPTAIIKYVIYTLKVMAKAYIHAEDASALKGRV